MAEIYQLPPRSDGGTIHIWSCEGGFELAHESRSGSSWGNFEVFNDPVAAVNAAHALNRSFGSDCDIAIRNDVLAALSGGTR